MKPESIIIVIKNLEVYSQHGYFEIERKLSQRFLLDVEVSYQPSKEEVSKLEECVDYEFLVKIVEKIMNQPVKLLETLTQRLNQAILDSDPRILSSQISICKYPIIGKKFESVKVQRKLLR